MCPLCNGQAPIAGPCERCVQNSSQLLGLPSVLDLLTIIYVDVEKAPQEYLNQQEPHPVPNHWFYSASTPAAGSFPGDLNPFQASDLVRVSCNDQIQPGRAPLLYGLSASHAFDNRPSPLRALNNDSSLSFALDDDASLSFDNHPFHSDASSNGPPLSGTETQGWVSNTNPVSTLSTEVPGTSAIPGGYPITPPEHNGESSQSQSMIHAHNTPR
jgi:hypothetical protein